MKNPAGALEIGVKTGTAAVIRDAKAVFSTIPDV